MHSSLPVLNAPPPLLASSGLFLSFDFFIFSYSLAFHCLSFDFFFTFLFNSLPFIFFPSSSSPSLLLPSFSLSLSSSLCESASPSVHKPALLAASNLLSHESTHSFFLYAHCASLLLSLVEGPISTREAALTALVHLSLYYEEGRTAVRYLSIC